MNFIIFFQVFKTKKYTQNFVETNVLLGAPHIMATGSKGPLSSIGQGTINIANKFSSTGQFLVLKLPKTIVMSAF
jgi:hypothetical protein